MFHLDSTYKITKNSYPLLIFGVSDINRKFFLLAAFIVSQTTAEIVKHCQLRDAVGPYMSFVKSFDKISKNQGIAFLALDPSETQLQLFHHSKVFGGSWSHPSHRLAAILGFDQNAHPIQIVQQLVKDIKAKSFAMMDFAANLESSELFATM
jgi:hypothetical protein